MNSRRRGQGILALTLPALAVMLALAGERRAADPPAKAAVDRPHQTFHRSAPCACPRRPITMPTSTCRLTSRPAAARRFDNTPRDNPVTDAGATLGRVLFYDTRLSANNTVACGSCHHQSRAFVDPNRFSKGFEGKLTDRNAMSLVNLRYYPRGRFFWDERARSLEEQVLMPIQSKIEMGQDLTKLVEILAKDDKYPELFRKAFGDSPRSRQARLARAMAQFLRSMVSYQSKYDEGLAQVRSCARRLRELHRPGEPRQDPVPEPLCHLPHAARPGRALLHESAAEQRTGCGRQEHRRRRRRRHP